MHPVHAPLGWRLSLCLALLWAALPSARLDAQVTARAVIANRADNTVTIIDTKTITRVGDVTLTGVRPVATAVSLDGAFAYVVNTNSNTVSVVDLVSRTEVTSIAGFAGPTSIALAPDGQTAYVTNFVNGTVSTVDLPTRAISGAFVVGDAPSDVAVSPDGALMYVTQFLAGTVAEVETATGSVRRSYTVGAGPSAIAVTPDGTTAYVTNNLSTNGTVSVLDLTAGIVRTTLVAGFDSDPADVAVSPDGREAYVIAKATAAIGVLDVATTTPTAAILLSDVPNGVAFTPDGRRAIVTSEVQNPGAFDAIDTVAQVITANVAVGRDPVGPSVGPNLIVEDGGPLTVANDAALQALGFRSHLVLAGGTLALSGNLTTNRIVSVQMLQPGQALGTIDTAGFTATLSGPIRGDAAVLQKIGAGTLSITGESTVFFTGIVAGRLLVTGTLTGTVAAYTSEVVGTGTIGTIDAQAGSTIRPGIDGPGELTATITRFIPEATFAVDLNGPVVGAGYDRLTSTDMTVLADAALDVSLGYAPTVGTTFVIATNVIGQFAGLPEGAVLRIGNHRLRVSYVGGNGNDAALTVIGDLPPTISAIADQQVLTNTVVGPLPVTIGDDWTAPATLTITATSSNQALVPDANITIGGSDAARTLTLTPLAGVEGTTTIIVSVTDDAGQVTTASFTVTVGARRYHLSEGATGAFFDMDLLLANPTTTPAPVTIQFLRDDGTVFEQTRTLAPTSRTTIAVDELDGLDAATFSTIVKSTASVPLAVERTMWWGQGRYGAHTEKASDGAAAEWLFAEGAEGFFKTYFLLANPQATPNVAHVTFYRQDDTPIARDYPLAARSRKTIDVSDEAALRTRTFGARVTFDQPGMAERAMYFGASPVFSGGSATAGVSAPATTWYFAEGATGSYFSTFLLLANSGAVDAAVTLTYLRETGAPIVTHHTVPARQRLTIDVAGDDPSLATSTAATIVTADQPIVAERSIYWPKPDWIESHNSAGVTVPGRSWALAEGRVGGADDAQTFILLANPNDAPATATVTFLRTDGTTHIASVAVPAMRRVTLAIAGPASDVPVLLDEPFGARIDATLPIIVERSLYTSANGVTWAAGSNATATRLPD